MHVPDCHCPYCGVAQMEIEVEHKLEESYKGSKLQSFFTRMHDLLFHKRNPDK